MNLIREMLKDIKDITAVVIDHGSYIAMAQRLARDYKKVYYCTSWEDAYPKWNKMSIGMNVPGVERVDHWAEVIDECDLVVFPDLYYGTLQDWLVSKGKVVFGARMGETMELYRDEFKVMLGDVGLNVNKHQTIYGFGNLKEYLNKHRDVWVKTSIIRGNGETFHWIDNRLSESRIDELQHQLGSFKDEAVFVVEDPIDDAVEIGFDGLIINGDVPDRTLWGIELKDTAYYGTVIPYADLPKILKEVNDKLKGFFAGVGYKGFFSNEVRWTGKKGYLIDPTTRIPQPPGDLQMEIYKDYSRYIWEVANGIVPDIEGTAKFGVQIIIKSDWATTDAQALYYPTKYANRIKIKNLMYKDNIPYYVPCDFEMCEIGSVVGLGNTLSDAILDAKTIAETVEGDGVSVNTKSLDDINEQVKKLQSYNIKLF